jgi:hypothetical protein
MREGIHRDVRPPGGQRAVTSEMQSIPEVSMPSITSFFAANTGPRSTAGGGVAALEAAGLRKPAEHRIASGTL